MTPARTCVSAAERLGSAQAMAAVAEIVAARKGFQVLLHAGTFSADGGGRGRFQVLRVDDGDGQQREDPFHAFSTGRRTLAARQEEDAQFFIPDPPPVDVVRSSLRLSVRD